MNALDALKLLRESLVKHGLDDWHGELDNAKRRFGVCNCRKKVISISRPLCELNTEYEVQDTILHEIAHALAWQRHGEKCGHDDRWKKICREVGARPIASYDDNDVITPEAPWILAHKETGEVFQSYFKRPNRNWSDIWIRGRKEETYGKLEIRPASSRLNSNHAKNIDNLPTEGNSPPENTAPPKNTAPAEDGIPKPNLKGPNTMTIESFDRHLVEKMQYEALLCLKAFAKERGIEVDINHCKYNNAQCDLSFRFTPPTPEGINKEQIEFGALAFMFDLTPEDYLREFVVNHQRFRLCGIKPKNHKYPIIALDDNDRRYKFDVSVLDHLVR